MPAKKTTTAIEKQAPKAGEIMLNLDNVRKYIAPTATIQECEELLSLCVIWGLNPFPPQPEVHFIKYDKAKPPSIVVAYMVYLKRADRQKTLKGWKVWVEGENGPHKQEMKACIQIYRKDWDQPFEHEVYFEEYAQYRYDQRSGKRVLTRFWQEKPRHMLKKVAIGQGFRMCFPDEMGGLPYISEEMPSEDAPVMELEDLPTKEAEVVEKKEEPEKKPEKPKEPPRPKKKPTLTTAKKPTSLIPDVPPELLDDSPKEGVSKEEYEKAKKQDAGVEDVLADIEPTEEDTEAKDLLADIALTDNVEDDGDRIALTNAIEQKLSLLDKHYGRKKIKLIEKIHVVLSDKFGVTVSKFPDDLSKEQLTYVLELLQVTVDSEEKKLRGEK